MNSNIFLTNPQAAQNELKIEENHKKRSLSVHKRIIFIPQLNQDIPDLKN